ncbi:hypothetical protein C8E89_1624, partial [Mycolicibacterium moriokaense]
LPSPLGSCTESRSKGVRIQASTRGQFSRVADTGREASRCGDHAVVAGPFDLHSQLCAGKSHFDRGLTVTQLSGWERSQGLAGKPGNGVWQVWAARPDLSEGSIRPPDLPWDGIFGSHANPPVGSNRTTGRHFTAASSLRGERLNRVVKWRRRGLTRRAPRSPRRCGCTDPSDWRARSRRLIDLRICFAAFVLRAPRQPR